MRLSPRELLKAAAGAFLLAVFLGLVLTFLAAVSAATPPALGCVTDSECEGVEFAPPPKFTPTGVVKYT